MLNYKKYKRVPVVDYPERQWPDKEIEKAPVWCSVDLRDGNQALVEPMVVEEKIEMFNLLLRLGFKEIEIGFPAASQIEYDFLRQLVERKLIPDDVTVQVLTQCREHLIRRTFEAIRGCQEGYRPHLQFHFHSSERCGVPQEQGGDQGDRRRGDQAGKEVHGRLTTAEVILEYSPESFTGTELDFALDICTAVQEDVAAHAGTQDHYQSSGYCGDDHPECVCGSDRVDEPTFQEPRHALF